MSLPTHRMRIALLINTSPTSPYEPHVRQSWKRALRAIEPTSAIDFFDPVLKGQFPDPRDYDLIVLSGGSVDPRSVEEGWVVRMREWVRGVVVDGDGDGERERGQEREGKAKLLGVCWGHQVICEALGGGIDEMGGGPVGDVSTFQLTPEGKAFLNFPAWKSSFTAPEFHIREVVRPVEGFIPLCEGNQAFMGDAGNIFTFQMHLEMDVSTVEAIIQYTDDYTKGKSEEEVRGVVERAAEGHDGGYVLGQVLRWVYDHNDC